MSALFSASSISPGDSPARTGFTRVRVADLLLGFPTRYRQDSNTIFNQWQNMYFVFVQDDWQVNSKLTLNIGLRYEFAPPPRERTTSGPTMILSATAIFLPRMEVLRAGLDSPGLQQFCSALRFRIRADARNGDSRRLWSLLQSHEPAGSGRYCLASTFHSSWWTQQIGGSNNLRATNAIFRLQDGIPAGFVDVTEGESRHGLP